MRVLVTGHHGYIGALVVSELVAGGHEVVGLDTFFYRGCDLLAGSTRIEEIDCDLRAVRPSHLDGIDAIAHFAALSNDPLGDLDPRLTFAINLEGTLRLARLAKEQSVGRFVFASSCSMYGASDGAAALDESAPLAPLTPYAESKVRAEAALHELADDDFSPVYLRNATAFGVSPRLRLDIVLNNLVGWAHTTGKVRLLSDGSAWRPLVHIEDIAAATRAVLEAPAELVHDQAFNIGWEGENHRIRELAEIVRDTVEGSTLELAAGGGTDPRSYRVDFAKFAGTFPALRRRWSAAAGAAELLDAYRKAGLTVDEMQGTRYIRLNHLRKLRDEGALDDELRWRRGRG